MAVAIRHVFDVEGIVLPLQMPTRELQQVTTKFWGIRGESRINGGTAGRFIEVPIVVYATRFNTQQKLSAWFDDLNQYQGRTSTLQIFSEADRPAMRDCTFDGALMETAPKMDIAGSLGGGAWMIARFLFRQHS